MRIERHPFNQSQDYGELSDGDAASNPSTDRFLCFVLRVGVACSSIGLSSLSHSGSASLRSLELPRRSMSTGLNRYSGACQRPAYPARAGWRMPVIR